MIIRSRSYPNCPILFDAKHSFCNNIISTHNNSSFTLQLPIENNIKSIVHIKPRNIYSRVPTTMYGLNEALVRAESGINFRNLFDRELSLYERLKNSDGGFGWKYGIWAYYPASGDFVQYPPHKLFRIAQIASNTNLILDPARTLSFPQVDDIFYHTVVGIIGLSIGSNIGKAITQALRPKSLVVSDYALFKETNTNRVLGLTYSNIVRSLADLRKTNSATSLKNKATTFAEQLHAEDPFINIYPYQGTSEGNLNALLSNRHHPKIDLLIDVCDSLRMKVSIAQAARKKGIRLIRVSDVGDKLYIDIRPFDKDHSANITLNFSDQKLLYLLEQAEETGTRENFFKFAKALVGKEHLEDQSEFADLINGTIPRTTASIPQWGPTTLVGAGWVATMIARMRLGHKFSERTIIDMKNSTIRTQGKII